MSQSTGFWSFKQQTQNIWSTIPSFVPTPTPGKKPESILSQVDSPLSQTATVSQCLITVAIATSQFTELSLLTAAMGKDGHQCFTLLHHYEQLNSPHFSTLIMSSLFVFGYMNGVNEIIRMETNQEMLHQGLLVI